MSAPALVAMPGGAFTPASLTARLQLLFGSSLLGLWIGDDIQVDESLNVTSWPGRVGPTLANSTDNRFTIGALGGRRALAPGTIAQPKSLQYQTISNVRSVIAFAECGAAVTAYETLTDAYNNAAALTIRNNLTGSFFTDLGWAHAVDGTLTEVIPAAGAHTIEGSRSTVTTGVAVGGNYASNRTWPYRIGTVLALDVVPSAARVAVAQLLTSYHGAAA